MMRNCFTCRPADASFPISNLYQIDLFGRWESNQYESPRILVLGDSPTMGWGVNDDQTYSYLIGLSTPVPIFNLAVWSYGTARELLRARRHPQFKNSKCLLIQYHENDLGENQTFLSAQGLPSPTAERFESLMRTKRENYLFLKS